MVWTPAAMAGKPEKVYVAVNTDFRTDGVMLPRRHLWEDGQQYVIDRVTYIREAGGIVVSGHRIRYTVIIRGQQRYLFFEQGINTNISNGRWFVERKAAG